jgi:hypothetical protein
VMGKMERPTQAVQRLAATGITSIKQLGGLFGIFAATDTTDVPNYKLLSDLYDTCDEALRAQVLQC